MAEHSHPAEARGAGRPALQVAEIFRRHGAAYARTHALSAQQHRVLRALMRCRTAEMGGHLDVCTDCGHQKPSYNSCRNRHCPTCQALAQARWIEERSARILPVHHFHAVFTLPAELRAVAVENPAFVYDLLLRTAAETLLELGHSRLDALLGVTCVLHTWTREMRLHPHAHCIVTGGGLSTDAERWVATRPNFLFPVPVMRKLFAGKIMHALCAAYERGELVLSGAAAPLADPNAFAKLRDRLYRKRWVVYAKRPFGGAAQVVSYLGRYTHRIAISSARLIALDDTHVTFRTRGEDRATVTNDEFIRRFLLHVLPPRFVKIRHSGLFSPGAIKTRFARARSLLEPVPVPVVAPPPAAADAATPRWEQRLEDLVGPTARRCPVCHVGVMNRVAELPRSAHRPFPLRAPDTS